MATLAEVRDLASAAHGAGEHQRALSIALVIREHFPRDYQNLELLGKLYLEGRMPEEARNAFQSVLEIDPEHVVARAALAMISEEEGRPDEALERFVEVLDLAPGNQEIVAEIERLQALLNRAGERLPRDSACLVARRSLLDGKYDSASAWFEEALRQCPDRLDVAVGLTRALWLARRPSEAEGVAREVLAGHPHCLPALGIAAAASSSWGGRETPELLTRAAEVDPDNGVTRSLFAEAGLAFPAAEGTATIPDAALRGLLRERPTDPNPSETGTEPAPVVGENLDSGAAAESLLALAEASPDDPRARWLAGDALAARGEFRMAVRQYRMVLAGENTN